MKVIVITGTPGSGKTTIANKVAKRVNGSIVIHANEMIKSRRLFSSYAKDGAMVANMRKLKADIQKEINGSGKGIVIVEGHLLCDIPIKNAVAVVIRQHLAVLEKRLKARKYDSKKIKENIVSEALDYCGISAESNYDHVIEIMDDRTAVSKIVKLIGGMKKKHHGIELLDELKDFTARSGWNKS